MLTCFLDFATGLNPLQMLQSMKQAYHTHFNAQCFLIDSGIKLFQTRSYFRTFRSDIQIVKTKWCQYLGAASSLDLLCLSFFIDVYCHWPYFRFGSWTEKLTRCLSIETWKDYYTKHLVKTGIKTPERPGSRSNRLLPDACHSGTCSPCWCADVWNSGIFLWQQTWYVWICLGSSKGRLLQLRWGWQRLANRFNKCREMMDSTSSLLRYSCFPSLADSWPLRLLSGSYLVVRCCWNTLA